MSFTDPIGDFVTRMRNAQHGRRTDCRAPWSRMKESIANLLKQREFVQNVQVEGEGKTKEIIVTFRPDRAPLLLKRVSSPGSRKYVGSADIRPLLHGAAMAILSTSSGLLSDADARQKGIGGELLCTVS